MHRVQLEMRAGMVDGPHPGGIGIEAACRVSAQGIIRPAAFPKLVAKRGIVIRHVVSGIVRQLMRPPEGA